MKKLLKSMVLLTVMVMMIAGVQVVAFADEESSEYETAVPISDELSQADDTATTTAADDDDDNVTNPDTGVNGIAPAAVALIAAGAAAVALKTKK